MRNTLKKRPVRAAVLAAAAVCLSASFGVSSASAWKWDGVPNGTSVPASIEGTLLVKNRVQLPWEPDPSISCTVNTNIVTNVLGQTFPALPAPVASNDASGIGRFTGRSLAICANGQRFGIILDGALTGTSTVSLAFGAGWSDYVQMSPFAPAYQYPQATTSTVVPLTNGTPGTTKSKITFTNKTISAPSNYLMIANGQLEIKTPSGGTLVAVP